ncbi:PAS domain-containing sensor histidine kinase [Robiginitomaculum antarcticum]|uniref:PAS domain-containing sensor histidine kinase n=1 Tax=Robiginitomaculum antarcticum TaxID=437507 RepID=UPI00036C8BC3|nr:PAS domain-containing sensor histidine kinase [Robiginitomaculum antarcticum]
MDSRNSDIAARATWKVTSDLLGVLDSSGLFADTNPAWLATLGYSALEIENRQFFDFLHPDDIETTQAAFVAVQSGEPVLNFKNRYRHTDGSYRWLSWNAVPVDDLYYCSARDITIDVEKASLLQTREEEAKLREEFVAVLGHDIRNPLASIIAASRIMRRAEQSDKNLDLLDAIEKSVGRITRLVDDVNDFTRTRLGGGLILHIEPDRALVPALDAAVAEIQVVNPSADIRSSIDIHQNVKCDISRIQQLVSNLLANAVTHGDISRPVRLRAHIEDGHFKIAICNAGEAIPPETQTMLFKPFFREEISASKNGLGLGLYISRQIALAHGGDLSVTSDEDETVFEFIMPV